MDIIHQGGKEMRRYNREILVEVFYDLAKDCERVEPNDKTQMVVIYENDDDSMFYAVMNGIVDYLAVIPGASQHFRSELRESPNCADVGF